MDVSGYSTLKQLVSDWLIDGYGKIELGRYHQGLRWAVRKYIQLKIHLIPENKAIKVVTQMDPYCIKLPSDYVSFKGIGIDSGGEFVPFHENPKMARYVGEECGDLTQGVDETQEVPQVSTWYTYTLEEDNQRVLIQGYPYRDDVILLYVSTGVKIGGDTVIPAKLLEVMLSWLHYMAAKHNNGTQFEVAEAWNTHVREVNMYQKLNFSLDKMYNILFDVVAKKM